jgi:hypothetical protein
MEEAYEELKAVNSDCGEHNAMNGTGNSKAPRSALVLENEYLRSVTTPILHNRIIPK